MSVFIPIALLAIVSITAGVLAVQTFTAREAAVTRLRRVSGREVTRVRSSDGSPLRESLSGLLAKLFGADEVPEPGQKATYANLRQQLIEAGYRRPSALAVYMTSRFVATLALALLAFPASIFLSSPLTVVFLLIAAAGLGFLGPGLVVSARRTARQRAIERSLPDAIDLMVVCVEAGLSLAATIDRVAKEFFRTNVTLASELKLTVLETQAGKSLSDALRALSSRNGVRDLNTLASSLIQTERLGTRIADTLRVQADALRTRRLQQAEEVAQRAPVKMLFPAALLIFPAIIVVLLMPAMLGTLGALQ